MQPESADELWVISLAPCNSKGGEATLNSRKLFESCGGGWWGEKEALVIQITHYETRFWSGWPGLLVSKSFHTRRFCNCRGKPWYKLQKVKRQERLFLDPFWSGADPRAWIMDSDEHRMLRDRRGLSLMWEQQQTGPGGGEALAREHSLRDSWPKKHLWKSHSWEAASQETLAVQKFSIQEIKICYGVTYGTTSANILHFQMFRELQKY